MLAEAIRQLPEAHFLFRYRGAVRVNNATALWNHLAWRPLISPRLGRHGRPHFRGA
jgi:hypothetical protein